MDYTTLGRTGLKVSVMGLGTGGHSRLGQQTGSSEEQSVALVQRALELGINFIDTAEAYGTESIVGQALQGRKREEFVLSTKKTIARDGVLVTSDDVRRGLDESLRRLGVGYVEVYHLHGVAPEQYDYACAELVPVLHQLQEEGKIRFLGITEVFARDTAHRMMARAVLDDCWDVVMVGFNILNQSARERVFEQTRQKNIGVLDMFAVRRALHQPELLRRLVAELIELGHIKSDSIEADAPLDFLLHEGGAHSIVDAAYRFCRAEPSVHVVLSGTGNPQHLEENVNSLLRSPLASADRERLMAIFAGVDTVSGQ